LRGWHFCQEYAHLNGEDFQQFIEALSLQLGEDIALIHMDRAGAHITNELSWPENLIPVCQPSHSPELNPIERVWEYIKQELVGEVFTTLEQLRERLKQVLEKITLSKLVRCHLTSLFLKPYSMQLHIKLVLLTAVIVPHLYEKGYRRFAKQFVK
jgi:transposase